MNERIPAEACRTIRASLRAHGGTGRPAIEFPAEETTRLPGGEVVVLVVDGRRRHARLADGFAGEGLRITHVGDSPRLARERGGTNRLVEWVESSGARVGGSVLIDAVDEGHRYGLRAPGADATYAATGTPDDSLSSIAEEFDL